MTIRSLAMPWAPAGDRQYSLPTSILLKLAIGEAPADVPALVDVSRRRLPPAASLDGGAIDRIVGEHAHAVRAVRVHGSCASATIRGSRHLGYDDVEQVTGVARTFLLKVPQGTQVGALVDRLSQVTTVESASPNYVSVTPFDFQSAVAADDDEAWAPRQMIRMAEALAYEPGDPGVICGLIDSGIAAEHDELASAFRAGYDTVRLGPADVGPGIDLMGDNARQDGDPADRFVGHGMGCAGIIAAAGLRMPPGLGGATRIIPLRALGAVRLPGKSQAVGLGAISDLDVALKLAVDLGAKILNLSFGTDDSALAPSSPKPHADVVDYALARGCVLIAASGNNGRETRYWPAAYPGVIAVGAAGVDRKPTAFSTRGEHVALCAPGERILTAGLTGYQYATGTSFAAPFVAATACLLVSRALRRAVPLDAYQVSEILMRSAQPFAGDGTGCGAGLLDAAAALRLLDETIDEAIPDSGGADDG